MPCSVHRLANNSLASNKHVYARFTSYGYALNAPPQAAWGLLASLLEIWLYFTFPDLHAVLYSFVGNRPLVVREGGKGAHFLSYANILDVPT